MSEVLVFLLSAVQKKTLKNKNIGKKFRSGAGLEFFSASVWANDWKVRKESLTSKKIGSKKVGDERERKKERVDTQRDWRERNECVCEWEREREKVLVHKFSRRSHRGREREKDIESAYECVSVWVCVWRNKEREREREWERKQLVKRAGYQENAENLRISICLKWLRKLFWRDKNY